MAEILGYHKLMRSSHLSTCAYTNTNTLLYEMIARIVDNTEAMNLLIQSILRKKPK